MESLEALLALARRKSSIDENNSWFKGPDTYLAAIKNEIDEVSEEISASRRCYLEDELGDVLWNYLNLLTAVEKETGINPDAVFARACQKYDERISGIESGESWAEIKAQQKRLLAAEYSADAGL